MRERKQVKDEKEEEKGTYCDILLLNTTKLLRCMKKMIKNDDADSRMRERKEAKGGKDGKEEDKGTYRDIFLLLHPP